MSDRDRALLIRALLTLGLVGASTGHFLRAAASRARIGFVSQNVLAAGERSAFILWSLLGALLASSLAAAWWWRRRATGGLPRVDAAARLLAPLVLLGVVPELLTALAWTDTLSLALTLGAFVLVFERLCRVHLGAHAALAPALPAPASWPLRLGPRAGPLVRRHGALALVAVCALAYALYASVYCLRNHGHFNTFGFDLGQMDNLFWNALHGRPLRNTALVRAGDWSELRSHAHLGVYLLLPFYALAPRAETLLVLQATIVGLGAVPVYRFAARRLPRPTAVCLACAYLLYPALHGATFFDFHFQTIAAGLLLWMIDCFDQGRTKTFLLLFAAALSCREDIALGLAAFGAVAALCPGRTRLGLVVVAVSTAYFALLRFVVMPRVGGWWFHDIYRALLPAGQDSFQGLVATLFSNPVFVWKTLLTADKLRYLLQVLVPVAFLVLRGRWLWLSLLPGAVSTLLTTGYPPATDLAFQYGALFPPYLFPAAALALAAFGVTDEGIRRRRAALAALTAGTLLATFHWGALPPRAGFRAGYGPVNFAPLEARDLAKSQAIRELVHLVPPDASLAAGEREVPHVSNRMDCFSLKTGGYEGADYILHVPGGDGHNSEGDRALQSGAYEQVAARPGVVLLKRRSPEGPARTLR